VASSGKAIDPAAQGLLVEITKGGGVRVTGTDLGLWGVGLHGEGGDAVWSGVIPAKAASVQGPVTLESEDGSLRLVCEDGAAYRLPTLGGDHFPPAPIIDGDPVEDVALLDALRVVAPAMSNDPRTATR